MKKLFSIICFCLCVVYASAQVVENGSLKDNWYISGNVGTNVWDNFRSWEEPNDILVNIAVGKEFTPIFGLEMDLMGGMNQGSKLFFDSHNLGLRATTNLTNLIYKGERRVFEPIILIGSGWYHAYKYNDVSVNGGIRFNFNVNNSWALSVTPEYMFLPKIEMHQVNCYVGATYRFKTTKGNFPIMKLYDESEIEALNATINDLRAENEELKSRKPVEVIKVDTVEITKTEFLTPAIQFLQNSSEIAATSYITVIELANHIVETGKSYLIDGYASVEGPTEFNNELSTARAESVKKALIDCGVSTDKLFVKGNGSTDQFGDLEFNRIVIVKEK